MYRNQCV